MSHNKNSPVLAGIIIIGMMVISACTQSYSQAPESTPTLIPTGLFVSPFPSVENPMAMIEEFAKGTATAAALTAAAGGTTGTPGTVEANTTPITPQTGGTVTVTSTPLTSTPGTPTNAIATTPVVVIVTTITPGGPTLTPIPPGVRPATYTLQKNEFPYCIARRFNVDPKELLAINGLSSWDIYMTGLTLKIPQTGSWPGTRALRNHPDTYSVTGSDDDNVYGVACKYGDVDPAAIAQLNGFSVGASLTIGQQVKIP